MFCICILIFRNFIQRSITANFNILTYAWGYFRLLKIPLGTWLVHEYQPGCQALKGHTFFSVLHLTCTLCAFHCQAVKCMQCTVHYSLSAVQKECMFPLLFQGILWNFEVVKKMFTIFKVAEKRVFPWSFDWHIWTLRFTPWVKCPIWPQELYRKNKTRELVPNFNTFYYVAQRHDFFQPLGVTPQMSLVMAR
jgi:hypothetical protein